MFSPTLGSTSTSDSELVTGVHAIVTSAGVTSAGVTSVGVTSVGVTSVDVTFAGVTVELDPENILKGNMEAEDCAILSKLYI